MFPSHLLPVLIKDLSSPFSNIRPMPRQLSMRGDARHFGVGAKEREKFIVGAGVQTI